MFVRPLDILENVINDYFLKW